MVLIVFFLFSFLDLPNARPMEERIRYFSKELNQLLRIYHRKLKGAAATEWFRTDIQPTLHVSACFSTIQFR